MVSVHFASELMYFGCVALGITLGVLLSGLSPSTLPANARRKLRIAALIGAVLGAYLFELPADLMALTEAAHDHRGSWLGGRTVLGGLAGGWIAVEWQKRRAQLAGPTGDGFVAPLSISLCFGRIGCFFGGCCWGQPSSAWPRLPWMDSARIPVPLFEALFLGCFAALAVSVLRLQHRRAEARSSGWLFIGFVFSYAVLRFSLEFARSNPRVLLGLSYYQWLACGLAAAACVVAGARVRTSTAR
jgi:phosphatidylglycerol---prolipoprotein diacylglyceryl transferase